MIRTDTVTLSVVPGIAYRQKLPAGGSGIVILKEGVAQPGIASISKTSGEAIPAPNNPKGAYSIEEFEEAIALTSGMPYKKKGSVKWKDVKHAQIEEPAADEEEEVIVNSAEYEKIVTEYTDKTGKLSYELLNRALIKFAHSSSKVRAMVEAGESVETIRLYITGTKYRSITGNHDLTDAQVLKISELLDDVYPKGVFRTLNDELRKKMKR